MKSIKEILVNDEFENRVSECNEFLFRRIRREAKRQENERIELKRKSENQNIRVAVQR
ncbi:MAG: hypothetical protein ACR2J3_01340 [Aridibacter sp.]